MADDSVVPISDTSVVVAPSPVVTDAPSSNDYTGPDITKSPINDPFIQPIDQTSPVSGAAARSTTSQSGVSLYGSYGDETSTTEQYPMQHATQQLPSDAVPLLTTDYTSSRSQPTDSTEVLTDSKTDSSQPTGASHDLPTVSDTIDSDIPSSSTATSDISSVDSLALASSQSSSLLVSSSETSQETHLAPVGTDHAPDVPSDSRISSSVAPTDAVNPRFTANSKVTPSSEYLPTTGVILTPLTASKTSVSSSAIALDTLSVKTTSAVPLTPPNMKPVSPANTQGTSLLGGGLSDYIVYIGAPLCGAGILILLIVCILCLRKRKAKSKGSPAKSQVQDLWVNSQAEIPLSNRSPLLEARGGDRHIQDLADSKLRRRKPDKPREVPVETLEKQSPGSLEGISDASSEETVDNSLDYMYSDDRSNKSLDTGSGRLSDCGEDVTKEVEDKDIDGCTTYEAVFDFPAEQDTHLSLQQGDIVKVTRKEDNGWWRGTIDNRIGWFPSNYVQPSLQADKLETENEVEMHNESHLSSFLIKKNLEPSPHSSLGNSPRNSYPTEEEIEAEPIYCKIQPKEKRKSTPKVPEKITPPPQLVNRENTPIPIEEGSRFRAIYPYDGHFHGELHLKKGDTIQGKEQDRNGWMNGYNEATGEEGWFPAVYVEKMLKEEAKAESPANLDTDPASYKELEANTRLDGKQDLVGIVHKAVHRFEAEKAGDLVFEEGDLITVFQVLENGWWLGCKDKTVGWFPGSFVQMIDQPSNGSGKNTPSPVSKVPLPSVDSGDTTPKKSKLRPVRKAPPPPTMEKSTESKIPSPVSKIPKKGIPVRTAPSVPSGGSSNSAFRSERGGDVEEIVNNNTNNDDKAGSLRPLHDGLYDVPDEIMNKPNTETKQKSKPELPKRYIKPKLVTIPRSQVNLPIDSGLHLPEEKTENRRPRPPPPPRPNPLKPGPIRAKLQAPQSPGHQSHSEEEESGFFHLNNHVNMDQFLRQDSSEPDTETDPYKVLSSFGSSFGKKEDVIENDPYKVLSSFGSSFGKKDDVIENDPYKELSSFGSSIGKKEDVINNSNNQYNKYPMLNHTSTGLSSGKGIDISEDTHTLDNTSPIVLNENRDTLQNHSFVINSKDGAEDESDFRYDQNSVTPMHYEQIAKTRNKNDFPELNKEMAEIPVTPTSPKKKESRSRLAPPKPVTLSLESTTEQVDTNKVKSVESTQSNTSSPVISKLPRSAGSGEPVSRLPVNRKETPVRSEEPKQSPAVSHTESPIADKNQNVHVSSNDPYDKKNVTLNDVHVSPQRKYKEEPVEASLSSEDEMRARTGSMDKPPVAPKPKPKGLPKLLPKPKAGIKSASKESENENELVKESGSPAVSSLPSTPVTKVEPEVPEVEVKPKEDEPTQTKKPLVSKIAQKSPQLRGRKSQIPASPGMRTKSKDRLEDVHARKTSESEETSGRTRKFSESDSDAPLSPVVNIRSKPESPMGARRVKKGESNLRNRSNSPHGRKGIPLSLKQRSNSPSSKLPRTGIPKPNTGSPLSTPTSNGSPSGMVQPKPIAMDQDIISPKSGPNSPRTETTPSPELEGLDNSKKKPDRPSKPPQVQKQKSQDGKPKQGKSLLPVIHKNMDAAAAAQNGGSPTLGSKTKRGIPVAKATRPLEPKSPLESDDSNDADQRTLYQAMKDYTARSEEELSFTEGTFVKELSDCDRPGWFVGMLADGTTGLYPSSHFKPSPVNAQSEA